MKQIVQSLSDGKVIAVEAPVPLAEHNSVIIRSTYSLVSPGTERMLLEFGRGGLVSKARNQPDKVKQVLQKVKTDGVISTLSAVQNKLSWPIPMGYSNVGEVAAVGSNVTNFQVGDRVVSNGYHAEFVSVNKNLCARIPETVADQTASFTVLGSIALQGIRLADVKICETVVVYGLGLIGLLAVQILRAAGSRVIGLDFNPQRLKLAQGFGAEVINLAECDDVKERVLFFNQGREVDSVLICAASSSDQIITNSAKICRQRGKVILVGTAETKFDRSEFYHKEISLQVSCSYGPGRYDPNYEENGNDYPFGLVRWTENRNFYAVLDLMKDKKIVVTDLISKTEPFKKAPELYDLMSIDQKILGLLFEYSGRASDNGGAIFEQEGLQVKATSVHAKQKLNSQTKPINVGFIGAGNYARSILCAAFKSGGAELSRVCSQKGLSAAILRDLKGFQKAVASPEEIFCDRSVDAVVIATKHNTHSDLIVRALKARKHVFVEKPLSISLRQLEQVKRVYEETVSSGFNPVFLVGYNRRFAPHIQKIVALLKDKSCPRSINITVNAGHVEQSNWQHDPKVGGGRLIGEGCHFIDLAMYLLDDDIASFGCVFAKVTSRDTFSISLKSENGSIASINYMSNGSKSFPKERIEVFVEGKVLQLDNFRRLRGYGWNNFKSMNFWRQEKGNKRCVHDFLKAINSGFASPISFEELYNSTKLAIRMANES